ncbi:hypothetical protein FF38_12204 [Lucilia cuprina]|uniref:Uncharacterized protein n=1 Tax=Lucilia cuprina TaxID=7375 RepID=A0A0L0BRA2_LUCCU|nr:hypothetical protein FF38_12204 [Lucilia cuprina]
MSLTSFQLKTLESVIKHDYEKERSVKTALKEVVHLQTLRCGRSNPGSNPGHGNV